MAPSASLAVVAVISGILLIADAANYHDRTSNVRQRVARPSEGPPRRLSEHLVSPGSPITSGRRRYPRGVTSSREARRRASRMVVVYTYGLTVAEVTYSANDHRLLYCRLDEFRESDQCEALMASQYRNRRIRQLCAKRMIKLIMECASVEHEEEFASGVVLGDDTGFLAGLTNGIFPGTKWCGKGNLAKDYFDLGSRVELDKCCRAHDFCPIKVVPWRSGYGERNWSFYTKSHCDCDADFYNCLRRVDSAAADTVGNLYFNQLKVPCLREKPGQDICPTVRFNADHCPTASLQDEIQLETHDTEFKFVEKNRTRSRSISNAQNVRHENVTPATGSSFSIWSSIW